MSKLTFRMQDDLTGQDISMTVETDPEIQAFIEHFGSFLIACTFPPRLVCDELDLDWIPDMRDDDD